MFRKNAFAVLLIVPILLAACGPQATQEPLPPQTEAVETPAPESAPPTETVPPTEEPVADNSAWVTYRDPRYGIGLAYPCWWTFTPMPEEGFGGAITLRSFDEDFFRSHSTKGAWTGAPPEGVFAIDVGVFEGFDPAMSITEAWATVTDPSMSVIASAEERMIGQNQAMVIQMQNVINSDDPLFTMYLFRLAPDKVLMFSPLFQERIDANDVQGILDSLSLSPDQEIVVPAFAPHDPLIAAACAGK